MMELDETGAQWTEESRESFRTATANLVEAIHRHSAALLELDQEAGEDALTEALTEAIAEAGEQLKTAASAYADAQFEFTGTVPPLGLDEEDDYEYAEDEDDLLAGGCEGDLEDDLDEDLDDDLEDDLAVEVLVEPVGEPVLRLTVLHRADFVVTDEPAVLQAGKEAQHESWDDDEAPATAGDVTDLGEALRQLHQSGGLEALADTPGLATAGATTWLLEATDLLDDHDPEDWPVSPFTPGENVSDRLIHRLDEVAG